MHLVALAVVCLALIFLSYYSPKVGFGALGVVGVLLVVLYLLDLDESSGFPAPPDSVVLDQTSAKFSYGDSWEYSGRISNSSEKSITDARLEIVMYDCPEESTTNLAECIVIGNEIDVVPINIPPRQARDFQDNVSFRNAEPKGTPKWTFKMLGIRVTD